MPGVPLVAYDNPSAFKGKMSRDVYRALAEIPEVVASKHVGGPALVPGLCLATCAVYASSREPLHAPMSKIEMDQP